MLGTFVAQEAATSEEQDADEGLVAAARGGDADAFAELVARHHKPIQRHVQWILGVGSGEDEDVTQEVLLRLYRFLPRFRGESTFKSWIYSIAGNVARTHRRRQVREQRQRAHDAKPASTPAVEVLGGGGNFDDQYSLRQLISVALHDLPPQLRRTVVLRDMHGLDYQEIAAIMGVPLGTVESRIFRGRQQLRLRLEALAGAGPATPL